MVLDSGATSSFVRPEENLSITGPSDKIVALPDGSTKRATLTAILPFDALSDEARKADVLPGLRPNSLVSVGKLADANYTTVFHPQGEGVTIHQENTLKLHLSRKPVLQGWRDANGLWQLSRTTNSLVQTGEVRMSRWQTSTACHQCPKQSDIFTQPLVFRSKTRGSTLSIMATILLGRDSPPKLLKSTFLSLLRLRKVT